MHHLLRVLRLPTSAGLGAAVGAIAAGLLAEPLGAPVLGGVAAVLGVAVLLALVLVGLPVLARAELSVRPARVVAGSSAQVVVGLRNRGPTPVVRGHVEVDLPDGTHTVPLGWVGLRREVLVETAIDLPRRGIHRVGPVRLVREDPCGLLRWSTRVGRPLELYVRPRTVPVESLGTGRVSDVDGVASDEVSMSDLAFHALREYVRGDDLRHVHWRSSAKADRLLVRQYHDTRRSRVCVLLDTEASAYAHGEDLETAVSVAASIGVRGLLDDLEVSLVAGEEELVNVDPDSFLDACCRVGADDRPWDEALARLLAVSPDPGLLVVVTGGGRAAEQVVEATAALSDRTRLLLISCARSGGTALRSTGRRSAIDLAALADLPGALDAYLWEEG